MGLDCNLCRFAHNSNEGLDNVTLLLMPLVGVGHIFHMRLLLFFGEFFLLLLHFLRKEGFICIPNTPLAMVLPHMLSPLTI